MAASTVGRVADYLPEYRVAFAVAYASGLVAMLQTFVYIAGAGAIEQNPVTRAAFAVLPETAGVGFAVVLGGKAVVLVALYRVVLPWTAEYARSVFGTDRDAALLAAWAGALVSGLDAGVNLFAPLVYPAPTLSRGVSVFMTVFLVAVVAGLLAMPDRDALGRNQRPSRPAMEVAD